MEFGFKAATGHQAHSCSFQSTLGPYIRDGFNTPAQKSEQTLGVFAVIIGHWSLSIDQVM